MLAPLLGVSVKSLASELSERNGYVVLARGLGDAEVARLEVRDLPGLTFAADSVRKMTGGDDFQPLLGGVNAAGVGNAGIEGADNTLLAGKAGSELIALAPGGYSLPAEPAHVRAARAGEGLVLTIDEPLQVDLGRNLVDHLEGLRV